MDYCALPTLHVYISHLATHAHCKRGVRAQSNDPREIIKSIYYNYYWAAMEQLAFYEHASQFICCISILLLHHK